MLAINAKTSHASAAWKLIQYLTSPQVEEARAVATGDPPSLPSAYTAQLLAAAPYFAQVKTLNSYAAPRPVSPNYLAVSADLQTLFSSVYANPRRQCRVVRLRGGGGHHKVRRERDAGH